MSNLSQKHKSLPPAAVEDIEFLLRVGEHPENIARRVGYSVNTLARNLHEVERHDLATPFDRTQRALRAGRPAVLA